MRHFLQIGSGANTAGVLAEIHRQPELWDENPHRRKIEEGPHGGMTDIWLRYNRMPKDGPVDWEKFNGPHFPVFYPAWHKIPSVQPIVYSVLAAVRGVMLGGVLITRIPPGGKIEPHRDDSWHVRHFNAKCYVVLQGNDKCFYQIGDERVAMRTGDTWTFDNRKVHSVDNQGDDWRMTLIVCCRTET